MLILVSSFRVQHFKRYSSRTFPKALKFWTNIIPLKLEKPMIKYKKRVIFLVALLAPGI